MLHWAARRASHASDGAELAGYHYQAYGLHVYSDFPLPDLPVAPSSRPDITICSPGDCPRLQPAESVGAPQDFAFGTREGSFRIVGGCEIAVRPSVPDRAAAVVSNMALALCLHQRGLCVLHGASFEIEGEAVCVIGPSGSGKSTLAGVLSTRGRPLIADDTCAIALETMCVHPSGGSLRLWPDSLSALGISATSLPLVFANGEKRRLSTRYRSQEARRISRVYTLRWNGIARPKLVRLAPSRAVVAMMQASHGLRVFAGEHLARVAHVAQTVPVLEITAARDFSVLPMIATLVEEPDRFHAL